MPSHEATILSDFLLAPAALRDVLTLKQFTDIFPKAHRSSPAIKELYQELHRQRGQDIERVRQNIAEEVKRSRKLKRDCARERQHEERTAVAGLDPIALGIEEEVGHTLSQLRIMKPIVNNRYLAVWPCTSQETTHTAVDSSKH